MQSLEHPLRLGSLLRERLSVIMMFVYSKKSIDQFTERHLTGVWKDLRHVMHKANERRAVKACLEMALYLRALDDETHLSKLYHELTAEIFCVASFSDASREKLPLREVANKIIHSMDLKFDFEATPDPILICLPKDDDRRGRKWVRAEINLAKLILLCASLIYE
jgi:hypothetical protein